MRFETHHETQYRYSSPVFLEPHTFFLRPREDGYHRLTSFYMTIEPQPMLNSFFIDPFGNIGSRVWFEGLWSEFTIRTRHEVEVFQPNPFNYFIDLSMEKLPVRYSEITKKNLSAYTQSIPVALPVREFSNRIAVASNHSTTVFLAELCRTIHMSLKHLDRPQGSPRAAVETLMLNQGACRDLTVLFMECCRAQGLIARFTSGYCGNNPTKPELHAWAEVYLEGGGWRGFDPSTGLACGEFHVPIASANEASAIAPVIGTFRGDLVSAQMETTIALHRIPAKVVSLLR